MYRPDVDIAIFGNEPPLLAPGARQRAFDKRPINIRWLLGAILTGLFGVLLIAGSVYTALDQETRFAKAPEAADRREKLLGVGPNLIRKGDRLLPFSESVTSRQTMRIAVTTKIDQKEIIRNRPFTKVSATLVTAISLASRIPNFDSARLVSEGGALSVDSLKNGVDVENSDVSISSRSLDENTDFTTNSTLEDAEAARIASHVMHARTGERVVIPTLAVNPLDPLSSFIGKADESVKVTEENVSPVSKSSTSGTKGGLIEKNVLVRQGQSLEEVLKGEGLNSQERQGIALALNKTDLERIREGYRVNILMGPKYGAQNFEALRVQLSLGNDVLAVLALTDLGKWVPVTIEDISTHADSEEDDESNSRGVNLYASLYETALRQDVPKSVIEEIVRVFAYDIDMNKRVSPGDSFELFFSEDTDNGNHDILFASLTVKGEEKKFYRFQTTDDGAYDYYDDNGRSARKFLLRKPMHGGIFRSGFGMRRHPILRYSKMHSGVDWADRVGTPIFAAGNGKVISAGWDSGYGRRVEIEHSHGYVTTYNHLSAFAKNIKDGVRVRQGQVIGYLGSSGLSTGPHLHYEVMINGHLVDPMRIKLPRGRELGGKMLGEYRREIQKIEGYLNKPGATIGAM